MELIIKVLAEQVNGICLLALLCY